jgi:hypothetical protein
MKRAKTQAGPPDEGRARSPHAFMREALDAKARLVEQRRRFLRAALAADADTLESSRGYCATDVDAYFDALAAEERAPLPRPQTWRK